MRLARIVACLTLATSGFAATHSWAQVVISTPQTTPEVISNGDALTVTATGAVTVSNDTAVEFDATDITGDILIDGTVKTTSTSETDHGIDLIDVGVDGSIIINGTVEAATGDAIDIQAFGKTLTGSITNNGTLEGGDGLLNVSGLEFEGGVLQGSLINSATGVITTSGDNGIKIDGDLDVDFTDNEGVIEGQVVNNGTITALCQALDIDSNAWIKSGIVNTGTLENTDTIGSCVLVEVDETSRVDGGISNTGLMKSGGDAIYIWNGSIVTGDIVNDNTIDAQGDGVQIDDATLEGNITNNNQIEAGDDGLILTTDSTMTGNITNNKLIKADGNGIKLRASSVMTGNIVNNKTIESGSDGIDLENSGLVGDIINNDKIEAGNNGILLAIGSVMTGDMINNKTITTGQHSIALRDSDTRLVGDIVNALGASITSTEGDGIKIDSDAALEGQLINRGTIISLEDEAFDLDGDASITGGIINSGTLRATATNEEAIEIDEDFQIDGGFNNSGLIESNQDVIEIEEFSILNGGLINSGRIRSNSDSGDEAIELRSGATLNGGLTNTGLIAAPDNALEFSSSSTMTGSLDNQSGGVIIGRVSITTGVDMINGGRWYMKTNADFDNPRQTGSVGAMSELDGTYTQTSSGLLGIASDASGFSQLSVDGDATFASSTQLHVDVKNDSQHLALDDRLENVVQATGTLTAGAFRITDNSSKFDFIVESDDNSLTLVVVEQVVPLPVPTLSVFALALLILMVIGLTNTTLIGSRLKSI